MKVESVLLTGASGFFGGYVVKALSGRYELVTLGRSEENIYQVDLAKEQPSFKRSFDIVVHAAGKAHVVPATPAESQDFFDVNVSGTENLLKGLEQSPGLPGAFVFISTVAVYGRSEGEMIEEAAPLAGDTPYAKSKIQTEDLLIKWCSGKNIKLTILRLPLIIGTAAPGNLRDLVRMMKRGFYLGIGSGKAKKSMVLAADVAGFIPQIASKGGTFNLTDGKNPTMAEFEKAVAQRLGKSGILRVGDPLIRFAAKIGDHLGKNFPLNSLRFQKLTSTLTFSDAKARTAGWHPKSVIDNLPEL